MTFTLIEPLTDATDVAALLFRTQLEANSDGSVEQRVEESRRPCGQRFSFRDPATMLIDLKVLLSTSNIPRAFPLS